jgi:cytochrome oxidase assembly protein ShyY1
MTRAVPVVPTIIVVLAAALMVRLGVWQLHRLHEKEALLARYAANAGRPPLPFAALFPVSDDALYRRTSFYCLDVVKWRAEAGRAADGTPGWRHIAACRTGAEGPGIAIDMGVSADAAAPAWKGGPVSGRLTRAPSDQPLIGRLFGRAAPPASPMIVSDRPAPGLKSSAQPNPADIPNNHLSYAVQWFLFAATALAIYAVALWQRWKKKAAPNPGHPGGSRNPGRD